MRTVKIYDFAEDCRSWVCEMNFAEKSYFIFPDIRKSHIHMGHCCRTHVRENRGTLCDATANLYAKGKHDSSLGDTFAYIEKFIHIRYFVEPQINI